MREQLPLHLVIGYSKTNVSFLATSTTRQKIPPAAGLKRKTDEFWPPISPLS
jgi:hypothetical protein